MKAFFTKSCLSLLLLFAGAAQAQTTQTISELVFKNPVLTTATNTAGKDGAIYRFNNVATGIDATVKIKRRSSAAVVLTNIDVTSTGWTKAFQPQLGIPGDVDPGKNWWMEFEMTFLESGTNNKKKLSKFNVTALDVDGDGKYIQEYVQMNKTKSMSCSPVTYLVNDQALSLASMPDDDNSGSNGQGSDKRVQGPTLNFTDIDTSATSVMSTFSYEDKDVIKFVIGAKSSGGTSNAGERLNSLWFKSFSLAPQGVLPVTFHSFSATLDKKNVLLKWEIDTDDDISYYTVERSTDGRSFSDIGIVMTSGILAAKEVATYQFKDQNVPAGGLVYYRLRWEERTRHTYRSAVKVVRPGKGNETTKLDAFPNPARDQVRLTLPDAWQGKPVQINVYGSNGLRVQQVQVAQASQTELLAVSSLAPGFYTIQASCEGQSAAQKMLKQ